MICKMTHAYGGGVVIHQSNFVGLLFYGGNDASFLSVLNDKLGHLCEEIVKAQ